MQHDNWSAHVHRCTDFTRSETIGTILDILLQQPPASVDQLYNMMRETLGWSWPEGEHAARQSAA